MYNVYVILDLIAQAITGGVHIFRHDAAAIRMFSDIAAADGTMLNKHPQDYALVRIGTLQDGLTPELQPESGQTVITGVAWAAAQRAAVPLNLNKEETR